MEPGPCETCGMDLDIHTRGQLKVCVRDLSDEISEPVRQEPHRSVLAPRPVHSYPTPWRVAESKGEHVIVVCADGHYTAEVPTLIAAEIIVAAVNAYAANASD